MITIDEHQKRLGTIETYLREEGAPFGRLSFLGMDQPACAVEHLTAAAQMAILGLNSCTLSCARNLL